MHYSPPGRYIWDAWYMPRYDEVHAFFLQARRSDGLSDGDEACIGHAVTTDLLHWQSCDHAIGPDADNPMDDGQPWTGCTIWHDGRAWLFYTMRGSASQLREQHIGLAWSFDMKHWSRYPGNPVLTPDPQWYATLEAPVPGVLDCRDMQIIRDTVRERWLGFFATRIPGRELPETAAIGCAWSHDLIHWQQLPPAFVPGNMACVEVPDVFEINGVWYMTCLTGHIYGNRDIFTDPNLAHGTIYASAERPEGPYQAPTGDNALLGARYTSPISCRSVLFHGERYMLYTDRERSPRCDTGNLTFGTLTTPKRIHAYQTGKLELRYSNLIEACSTGDWLTPESWGIDDPHPWGQIWPLPSCTWRIKSEESDAFSDIVVHGTCRTGWGVLPAHCPLSDGIIECDIQADRCASAGILVHAVNHMQGAVVCIDRERCEVMYTDAPRFEFTESRRTDIPANGWRHLRVVLYQEHVEVYLDDSLRLTFTRYTGIGGDVGLFVDRGHAVFRRFRILKLHRNR